MPVALAHTYHEAGTISAQIHVSPDDSPKAKEKSYIHTQVSDMSGKFSLENCECTIKVFRGNMEVYSSPYDEIVNITFPEKGIYRIEFSGIPKDDGQFNEFKFYSEVRVEESLGGQPISHMSVYLCCTVIILLVVGFFVYKYVSKSRK